MLVEASGQRVGEEDMSLAIQFIDQPQVTEETELRKLQEAPAEPALREAGFDEPPFNESVFQDGDAESSLDNIALFEPAAETKLRRANELIAVLHAEIFALREELAGAERQLRHKELLLTNARVREIELRAQFVK